MSQDKGQRNRERQGMAEKADGERGTAEQGQMLARQVRAEPEMEGRQSPMMEMLGEMMEQCISDCEDCRDVCKQTILHCLEMGGRHAEPRHIRLLMDCAEICQISADYMLRNSPLHHRTCAVCSDVCVACAESCEKLAEGDPVMQACVDVCRQCAESCHQMASMV